MFQDRNFPLLGMQILTKTRKLLHLFQLQIISFPPFISDSILSFALPKFRGKCPGSCHDPETLVPWSEGGFIHFHGIQIKTLLCKTLWHGIGQSGTILKKAVAHLVMPESTQKTEKRETKQRQSDKGQNAPAHGTSLITSHITINVYRQQEYKQHHTQLCIQFLFWIIPNLEDISLCTLLEATLSVFFYSVNNRNGAGLGAGLVLVPNWHPKLLLVDFTHLHRRFHRIFLSSLCARHKGESGHFSDSRIVRASQISRKRREVTAPSIGCFRAPTKPTVDAIRRRDLVIGFDVG